MRNVEIMRNGRRSDHVLRRETLQVKDRMEAQGSDVGWVKLQEEKEERYVNPTSARWPVRKSIVETCWTTMKMAVDNVQGPGRKFEWGRN